MFLALANFTCGAKKTQQIGRLKGRTRKDIHKEKTQRGRKEGFQMFQGCVETLRVYVTLVKEAATKTTFILKRSFLSVFI